MSSKFNRNVAEYYKNFESRFGYDLVLKGIKHFGYYPSPNSNIQESKAQELMQDLIAKKISLTNKDMALDAGCGQGHVATYLAKKIGCQIVGITITPFEVKKAENLAIKKQVSERVKFLQMDYTKTNFPDNYFDAIYTMETLVHAYDLKETLKEFKRILKPRGRVAFFEYSKASDAQLKLFDKHYRLSFRKTYDWVIKKSAMFGLEKLSHGKLEKLVSNYGFTNVKVEDITPNILPSFAKLYRLAKLPYRLIKLLKLQNFFINTTVAAEWMSILVKYPKKDLFKYSIITAEKT